MQKKHAFNSTTSSCTHIFRCATITKVITARYKSCLCLLWLRLKPQITHIQRVAIYDDSSSRPWRNRIEWDPVFQLKGHLQCWVNALFLKAKLRSPHHLRSYFPIRKFPFLVTTLFEYRQDTMLHRLMLSWVFCHNLGHKTLREEHS